MVYHRFSEWFVTFAKEWLIPKAALAFGVSAVSAVLFSVDPAQLQSEEVVTQFDGIFSLSSSKAFPPLLFGLGVALLLSLLAHMYSARKSRRLFWLERRAPQLAFAVNTLFGLLLVPMVVAVTATYLLPALSLQFKISLTGYAAAFVVIAAGFHYLGALDPHPQHCITYLVSKIDESAEDSFHYATSGRLKEVLSHVPWLGALATSVETSDRFAVIHIPVLLDIKSWTSEEIRSLNIYLNAIELEWREKRIEYSRSMSPQIKQHVGGGDAT